MRTMKKSNIFLNIAAAGFGAWIVLVYHENRYSSHFIIVIVAFAALGIISEVMERKKGEEEILK